MRQWFLAAGAAGVAGPVGCSEAATGTTTDTDASAGDTTTEDVTPTTSTSAAPTTSTGDGSTAGTTDTTTESATNPIDPTTTTTTTTGTTTTGTTTTGDTGTTTTTTITTTTGDTDDEPAVSFAGPQWIHYITGESSPDPTIATPLPGGQVFVVGGGGTFGETITLGAGTPEALTYNLGTGTTTFAEWLDGSTGARLSSRLLSTTKSAAGSSASSRDVALSPGGDITVVGYWWGENYFHRSTPHESVMTSATLLVGDNFHRAEDPFFTRMDEAGAVDWLRRGWTPSPLSATWFNKPHGVVTLPDGDTLAVGDYDRPGFVLGHGTPGAKTMSGDSSLSAYIARLDDDGVPLWAAECDADFVSRSLVASPNGAVYVMAGENTTLFKGGAGELLIPFEVDDDPSQWMRPLIRVDPDGAALWARRIVTHNYFTPSVVARDDDSAVVAVLADGDLQIRDEEGVAASLTTTGPEVVVTSFAADGTIAWLLQTGLETGGWLAHADGELWVVGTIPADAAAIKIGDQDVALPPVDVDPALRLHVMIRLSPGGGALEVRVLAAGPTWAVNQAKTDGFDLILTGNYLCEDPPPIVFDGMGVGTPMASACDQPDTQAARAHVMSVAI